MPARGEDRFGARFLGKIRGGAESFSTVRVEPSELPSLLLPTENASEYTTRLAAGPRLPRYADPYRALIRSTLQRCGAAPHPPVRRAHRPHPGLHGRPG